ncbi:MAG: polysaccharide biosynthesis/export family protein [Myxococcota bacterium]
MLMVLLAAHTLASAASSPDYEIGPGDVLKVEIHGETFGGSFVVGSDGDVSIPYCGMLDLGAHTVFAAEIAIRDCLADGYLVDPQVSVSVEEYRSQKVEVLGAVAKPGLYYLQAAENTLRAVIGKAGGIQSEKSIGRVVVNRANNEQLVVLLDELSGPAGEFELQRGDVITVGEGEVVYVGGEVQKPGAIGYLDGMTVTQALMKAGGPTGIARLRGAYLLRADDRISVNLRRMLRGKDGDFVMEPGDRLVIQESPL